MTRDELYERQRALYQRMEEMTEPHEDGVRRIKQQHFDEWMRAYSRARAQLAIMDGHASEVRAALRECGVYEDGEVK